MTDITIYKPPSVTVRLVNGQYVIIKPPGMTISAINVNPPAPPVVSGMRATQQGWPVKKSRR